MKPRTQKSPESVVREIKWNTRRKITVEEKISEESISQILKKKKASGSVYDLPLFQPLKGGNGDDSDELVRKALANHPVFKTLTDLDINTLTPLEALTALSDLKKQLDEEDPPFISDQPWAACWRV